MHSMLFQILFLFNIRERVGLNRTFVFLTIKKSIRKIQAVRRLLVYLHLKINLLGHNEDGFFPVEKTIFWIGYT